jgi:hypothetical protein
MFLSKKIDPLSVKKLLPTGMTEFDVWSDRIIQLTGLTATPDSQKFALASMINTLGKTECDKEDLFFIKALHKGAADQIALAQMDQIRAKVKARLSDEAEKQKQVSQPVQQTSEVTPAKDGAPNVVLGKT